ncbi:FAR1-related sequence 5-like protein [Tanacetum coccineum]
MIIEVWCIFSVNVMPILIELNCLHPNQSSNSINTLSIYRSSNPIGNSSSNSYDNISTTSSSNPFDVDVATISDRPRSWIPDVESNLKPSKGHIFVLSTQAYNFYRHYGKLGEFDIKLGTKKNYPFIEVPDLKYFSCTRGDKKRDSKYDNHKFGMSVGNRDKGIGKAVDDGSSGKGKKIDVSKAQMRVRKINGDMFEVYVFVEEHNHPLVSQEDIQFMMSFRDLGYSKQQFLYQVSYSNVGPVRAFESMKKMYGGFENIGANAVDCKNFRRDMNMFIGDRDAQMAVEKLENLEKHCEGFFMNYCQGEGDSLTLMYKMVFVPFIGIDNHNRSVTFRAGLLSDETVNSYKFHLQAFKKHLLLIRKIVCNERISTMMFEEEWASIMDDFDLGSHKCLMRTTSRSESENRYFNRFTNPDLTLVELLSHFESAMDCQRYTQRKNDQESRYNRPEFRTELQLEKDVVDLYTLNIFYKVQDEIVVSITRCLLANVEHIGQFEKYFIHDTKVLYCPLILQLLAHADGRNYMVCYAVTSSMF